MVGQIKKWGYQSLWGLLLNQDCIGFINDIKYYGES